MEIHPLALTGKLGLETPAIVLRDLAGCYGYRVIGSLDVKSIQSLLNLVETINLRNDAISIMDPDTKEPDWTNLIRMVNPNESWPKRILLAVFGRYRNLYSEGLRHLNQTANIQQLLQAGYRVGAPTIKEQQLIPCHIAYAIARSQGYRFHLASPVSELEAALLQIKHGAPPITALNLTQLPQLVRQLPLYCNWHYHPEPLRLYERDQLNETGSLVRRAHYDLQVNLLYCNNPGNVYNHLTDNSPRVGNEWYYYWSQINPEYFDTSKRYDANIPLMWYDRSAITERYQANSLEELNYRELLIEDGPHPLGNPVELQAPSVHFIGTALLAPRNLSLTRLIELITAPTHCFEVELAREIPGVLYRAIANYVLRYPSRFNAVDQAVLPKLQALAAAEQLAMDISQDAQLSASKLRQVIGALGVEPQQAYQLLELEVEPADYEAAVPLLRWLLQQRLNE